MAKIKSPTPKLRLAHWSVLLLSVIFVAAAIYAMTTWNDSKNSQSPASSVSAANGLKVNGSSSSPSDINNNPMSAQSATTTQGGQNTQPSAPSTPGTNYNYDYPANPTPCPPGNREIACIQQ
jgi:cytoskeletal protein RodZ